MNKHLFQKRIKTVFNSFLIIIENLAIGVTKELLDPTKKGCVYEASKP